MEIVSIFQNKLKIRNKIIITIQMYYMKIIDRSLLSILYKMLSVMHHLPKKVKYILILYFPALNPLLSNAWFYFLEK